MSAETQPGRKMIVLEDDPEHEVRIKGADRFFRHIQKFHGSEISIHDENGHCFIVDDAIRIRLDQLMQNGQKA